MKKTYMLLTALLVALLLFAACTKAPDQNDAQPPVSDNNTTQDSNSVRDDSIAQTNNQQGSNVTPPSGQSAPVVPESSGNIACPFDSVTFKHTSRIKIFVGASAEGGNNVKEAESEGQYTFYYDWENDSFVDKIYKLLKQCDEAVQPREGEATFSNTAHFYMRDGDDGEIVEFDYPNNEASTYGAKRIWVKTSETQRRALTIEATEQFVELCSKKGLTADNFFAVYPHQSMIDWAVSFQTEAPILLYDANRELTAEQAAEKMLYELGEQLAQPAIDRYFYYENYSGWDFELYSNKTGDESVKDLYHTDNLTDDQYVVDWGNIRGDLVGINEISSGGYVERYFLEYEAGIWRLWLRDRP